MSTSAGWAPTGLNKWLVVELLVVASDNKYPFSGALR
jgi:hypothetical protein